MKETVQLKKWSRLQLKLRTATAKKLEFAGKRLRIIQIRQIFGRKRNSLDFGQPGYRYSNNKRDSGNRKRVKRA